MAYLSRYTHRVAIANSRLIHHFQVKGRKRYKIMTLAPHEFIRRFLIRLFANGSRVDNIAKARELLDVPELANTADVDGEPSGEAATSTGQCPCCGGHMVIIEIFERGAWPRAPPPPQDTSP